MSTPPGPQDSTWLLGVLLLAGAAAGLIAGSGKSSIPIEKKPATDVPPTQAQTHADQTAEWWDATMKIPPQDMVPHGSSGGATDVVPGQSAGTQKTDGGWWDAGLKTSNQDVLPHGGSSGGTAISNVSPQGTPPVLTTIFGTEYFDPTTGRTRTIPNGWVKLQPGPRDPRPGPSNFVSYPVGHEPQIFVNRKTGEQIWVPFEQDAPAGWVLRNPSVVSAGASGSEYLNPDTGQVSLIPNNWVELQPAPPVPGSYGGLASPVYAPGSEPRLVVDPRTGEQQWVLSGEKPPEGWVLKDPFVQGLSSATTRKPDRPVPMKAQTNNAATRPVDAGRGGTGVVRQEQGQAKAPINASSATKPASGGLTRAAGEQRASAPTKTSTSIGSHQPNAADAIPNASASTSSANPGDRNEGGGHTFSRGTTHEDLVQANRPVTPEDKALAQLAHSGGMDEYAERELRIREGMSEIAAQRHAMTQQNELFDKHIDQIRNKVASEQRAEKRSPAAKAALQADIDRLRRRIDQIKNGVANNEELDPYDEYTPAAAFVLDVFNNAQKLLSYPIDKIVESKTLYLLQQALDWRVKALQDDEDVGIVARKQQLDTQIKDLQAKRDAVVANHGQLGAMAWDLWNGPDLQKLRDLRARTDEMEKDPEAFVWVRQSNMSDLYQQRRELQQRFDNGETEVEGYLRNTNDLIAAYENTTKKIREASTALNKLYRNRNDLRKRLQQATQEGRDEDIPAIQGQLDDTQMKIYENEAFLAANPDGTAEVNRILDKANDLLVQQAISAGAGLAMSKLHEGVVKTVEAAVDSTTGKAVVKRLGGSGNGPDVRRSSFDPSVSTDGETRPRTSATKASKKPGLNQGREDWPALSPDDTRNPPPKPLYDAREQPLPPDEIPPSVQEGPTCAATTIADSIRAYGKEIGADDVLQAGRLAAAKDPTLAPPTADGIMTRETRAAAARELGFEAKDASFQSIEDLKALHDKSEVAVSVNTPRGGSHVMRVVNVEPSPLSVRNAADPSQRTLGKVTLANTWETNIPGQEGGQIVEMSYEDFFQLTKSGSTESHGYAMTIEPSGKASVTQKVSRPPQTGRSWSGGVSGGSMETEGPHSLQSEGLMPSNDLDVDLAKARERVADQSAPGKVGTVAVAKSDIEGLNHRVFEGKSASLHENGWEWTKEGDIQSDHPIEWRHAEEDLANQFQTAFEGTGKDPEEIKGTIEMHVDQRLCNACRDSYAIHEGPLGQLSERYPNVRIEVSNSMDGQVIIFEGGTVTTN